MIELYLCPHWPQPVKISERACAKIKRRGKHKPCQGCQGVRAISEAQAIDTSKLTEPKAIPRRHWAGKRHRRITPFVKPYELWRGHT